MLAHTFDQFKNRRLTLVLKRSEKVLVSTCNISSQMFEVLQVVVLLSMPYAYRLVIHRDKVCLHTQSMDIDEESDLRLYGPGPQIRVRN